jgi:uncharacterized protein
MSEILNAIFDQQGTMEHWAYNIGATLYTPETLFEERIENRWSVFAPDFEGLPILLDDRLYGFLDQFRGGAMVSDVITKDGDFVSALSAINLLAERGFLREVPAQLPYSMPKRSTAAKNFSIWLHITNSCNLKCGYCFVGEKTKDSMTEDVMDKVAADIAQTARKHASERIDIKFAGGEPSPFVAKMEKFRSLLLTELDGSGVETHFSVLSNGTILNDRFLRFLKLSNTSISISLDGFGGAHDTHRVFGSGKGSWDIISRNIQTLIKHGIRPYVMATISQETCHSLPDLVKWIYDNGLRSRLSVVRQPNNSWAPLVQLQRAGGPVISREREYEIMNTTLAEAFDRVFAMLEDPSVFMDLRVGLDLCELYFDRPTRGAPCGIGHDHLIIKPDAHMVSCPMTVAEEGIPSNGDLLETAKQTFAFSPSDRHTNDNSDDCLNCRWFGVCSGGCPITNLRIKGHAFTRSPLCSFYKSVIPRYLRFFGRKLLQAEQLAGAMN